MKISLLVTSLMAASALTAFSQGTVVFNNLNAVRAPIILTPLRFSQLQGQPTVTIANSTPTGTTDYGVGAAPADGTGFTAEMWAGADAASLTAVTGSQTPLRTGSTAGYVTQIATLAIAQITPGNSGTLQVRAWDNNNGAITSWAAAIAGGNLRARGQSATWVNATGGAGVPPSAPAGLTGWTAFNIFSPVPEPSMIALGALGLGALLLRRRKA